MTGADHKVFGSCFKCHERPGTSWWSEGAMAYVHGAKQPVCDLCAARMQLDHARERAKEISVLETQVAALEASYRLCGARTTSGELAFCERRQHPEDPEWHRAGDHVWHGSLATTVETKR